LATVDWMRLTPVGTYLVETHKCGYHPAMQAGRTNFGS